LCFCCCCCCCCCWDNSIESCLFVLHRQGTEYSGLLECLKKHGVCYDKRAKGFKHNASVQQHGW
jgi:hypothetical protein